MTYILPLVDDTFFERAPAVIPARVEIDAEPAAVWALLGSDAMWSWAPIIDQVRWSTPRPHAAGSLRYLKLFGLVTLEEEFYRWDDAALRATFRVTRQSRRVFDGLAEDFLVEPLDGGTRSRLTWTMAVAPRGLPAPPKALIPALSLGNAQALAGIKSVL
jgi:Polyketide cyclase / dehydrase and lipid transport